MTSHAPGIDAQWAAIFGPLELLVRLVDGALHGHLLKLLAPNVLQRDGEGHWLFCEPKTKHNVVKVMEYHASSSLGSEQITFT